MFEPVTSDRNGFFPLTAQEKDQLHQLEGVIEKHLDGFLAVGKSMLAIRDSRLYREQYPNFESYVRDRWGMSAHRCNELCRGVKVAESLLSGVGAPGTDTPLPKDIPELTLRPLTRIAEPELRSQTWRLVSLISPQGRPGHTVVAQGSEAGQGDDFGGRREERGQASRGFQPGENGFAGA